MQTVRLADVCKKITKGTTPSKKIGGFANSGINYVKSEAISYEGYIDKSKFAFITNETHVALRRSQICEGDILYSIAGVHLGKCASIHAEFLPANTNQAVAIIRVDEGKALPKYIEYFLRNRVFVRSVLAGVAQSAQPNVNLTEIGNFKIKLPNYEDQLAIASLLSAIDEKIENNRRMNDTLVEMARAIFKSWFVDFDPIHAKARGKQPAHMDAETAALFPNSFDDDGLPAGWRLGTVSDLAALNKKSHTARNPPSVIWYADLANTKNGTIESIEYFDWADAPSRARRIVDFGDTIVGTVRPGNRSYAFVGQTENPVTASTGFAVLSPKKTTFVELVYFCATSPQNIDRLSHLADGAAYPAVRPEVVASTEIALPTDQVIEAFHSKTKNLLLLADSNRSENQSLSNMRDVLLPKLMSGELRIENAEAEVAANL